MAPKETKKETDAARPEDQTESSDGVVENLLRGLGTALPSFGGLIKGLEKSEALKERLKEANEEIEARLKEATLEGGTGEQRPRRPRVGGIPRRSAAKRESVVGVKRDREVSVDVFDEGDHWRITAEMPGVDENQIKLDLSGDTLTISADTPNRKYDRVVKLLGPSRRILQTAYRNGILEVKLEKGSD